MAANHNRIPTEPTLELCKLAHVVHYEDQILLICCLQRREISKRGYHEHFFLKASFWVEFSARLVSISLSFLLLSIW